MKTLIVLGLLALASLASSLHFSVKDPNTQKYCLIMDANITGSVQYYDDVDNKTKTYTFAINDTTLTSHHDGDCLYPVTAMNTTLNRLSIAFVPNDHSPVVPEERWNLTIYFDNKDGKDFHIYDFKLLAHFYPDKFNTSHENYTYTKDSKAELEWAGEDNHGFSCSSTGLSLTNSSSVEFKDLKVLAFALKENDTLADTQFEQCKLDVRTSDLVPIIVGACLAGLVVIVLIAYLIGRARAKRQGYASV